MKKLIIIHSTEGRLIEFEAKGFFIRFINEINYLKNYFNISLYTSDTKNYSDILGINHHTLPFKLLAKIWGLRHIIFYINLIFNSFFWKNSVIYLISSSLPVVFFIKLFSKSKIIMEFKYDWAYGVKKDYRGFKGLISNLVQSLSFKFSDYIICTTNRLAELAKNNYKKQNVSVVPNFVNDEFYLSLSDLDKKENIIIYTGRLHKSKGVDILIEAFKEINIDNWYLYIIGDGEDRNYFESLKRYKTNIVFTGNLNYEKVNEYLKKSKIFVLPSRNAEGHSKSLIEAMANLCIPVVSNVRGNNDIILHNKNGFLFESGNITNLKNILIDIINNKITIDFKELINTTKDYKFDIVMDKKIKIIEELYEQ